MSIYPSNLPYGAREICKRGASRTASCSFCGGGRGFSFWLSEKRGLCDVKIAWQAVWILSGSGEESKKSWQRY